MKFFKGFFLSLIILVFFIIDRLSKWLVLYKLSPHGVFLFDKFFQLKLEKNQGVAFGIYLPFKIILILNLLILIILIYYLIKSCRVKNFFLTNSLTFTPHFAKRDKVWGFTLIIIGTLSNFFDRVYYGYVIDFIDISFLTIFNLADAAIVIGVLGWLVVNIWPTQSSVATS